LHIAAFGDIPAEGDRIPRASEPRELPRFMVGRYLNHEIAAERLDRNRSSAWTESRRALEQLSASSP
jgi:hypothetical protein